MAAVPGRSAQAGDIPAVPYPSPGDTRAPRAVALLGTAVLSPLAPLSTAASYTQERVGRRAPHGIHTALPHRARENYGSQLSLPGPRAPPLPPLLPAPARFLPCRPAFPFPGAALPAGRGGRRQRQVAPRASRPYVPQGQLSAAGRVNCVGECRAVLLLYLRVESGVIVLLCI